jgi:hypothetical protein
MLRYRKEGLAMTPSKARANEQALSQNVWVEPLGNDTYCTPSISRPGQFHTVTVDDAGYTHCDCPAGIANNPCKHTAAVCMHIYEQRELQRANQRAKAMRDLEEWLS